MFTGADGLVVVGAAFEVLGVATIVLDLRSTSREVRAFISRGQTRYGAADLEAQRATVTGTGVVSQGREPTIEERVASLEKQAAAFPKLVEDSVARARDDMRAWTNRRLRTAIELVELTANDWQAAMERLVRGVTIGGLRVRAVGVVLAVVGIVLATIGSVLQ